MYENRRRTRTYTHSDGWSDVFEYMRLSEDEAEAKEININLQGQPKKQEKGSAVEEEL